MQSMTGHGQARVSESDLEVWAEIRSVNNRYLKVTVSTPDRLADLEAAVRQLVGDHLRRGSVYINLEITRSVGDKCATVNKELLRTLLTQARAVDPDVSADALLAVPGVVEFSSSRSSDTNRDWPVIEKALQQALVELLEMRRVEGEAMVRDLRDNCSVISEELQTIIGRAPQVVSNYATRLTDRINQMLEGHDVAIKPSDVVREVGVFADRCDISEETVRLQQHINQFQQIIETGEGDGRKLEFLTQEMLRETNTIGSKGNDGDISKSVVEIKTAIERIREMTQNIE